MAERFTILVRARDLASKVFSNVRRRIMRFGDALRRMRVLFLGAAAGAAALTAGLLKAFRVGANAAATQSRFNTVLGEAAERMDAFVESFAPLAGLTRTEGRDVVATTAAIAQGLGFMGTASADVAESVTKLAGDLASFNNLPTVEAARAIQAALTGEFDSLKRLKIVIREADVQQRALAVTGKATADSLTDQEKALATLNLAYERAGKAVGDLTRTQNDPDNRAKQVAAEFRNIGEAISLAMLPALEQLIPLLEELAKKIEPVASAVAKLVTNMLDAAGITNRFERELTSALSGIADPSELLQRAEDLARVRNEIQRRIEAVEQQARGESGIVRRGRLSTVKGLKKQVSAFDAAIAFAVSRARTLQQAGGGAGAPSVTPGVPGISRAERVAQDRRFLEFLAGRVPRLGAPGFGHQGTVMAPGFEESVDNLLAVSDASEDATTAVLSNVESMVGAVASGSAQMEQVIVSSFTNILQNLKGISPLGVGLLGIGGALLSGLFSRRDPQPVRIARFEPEAARQLEEHQGGPRVVNVTILGADGKPISQIQANLAARERRDAIDRFTDIIRRAG